MVWENISGFEKLIALILATTISLVVWGFKSHFVSKNEFTAYKEQQTKEIHKLNISFTEMKTILSHIDNTVTELKEFIQQKKKK